MSDIFFQQRVFYSKSGFCSFLFSTGFPVPVTRKNYCVTARLPHITMSSDLQRRGIIFFGSQEKKCPPCTTLSFFFHIRYVPNGHGQKMCSEKFLVSGIFLILVMENFSQISYQTLNCFKISGKNAIIGFQLLDHFQITVVVKKF